MGDSRKSRSKSKLNLEKTFTPVETFWEKLELTISKNDDKIMAVKKALGDLQSPQETERSILDTSDESDFIQSIHINYDLLDKKDIKCPIERTMSMDDKPVDSKPIIRLNIKNRNKSETTDSESRDFLECKISNDVKVEQSSTNKNQPNVIDNDESEEVFLSCPHCSYKSPQQY